MLPPCPQPPDWTIDWPTLEPFSWLADLKGCPQNPHRHAEGDVWTHVHMVCEAMAAMPAWRALPENDRRLTFSAALFHDVAKPACTRMEADGSLSSRGHSWRGAVRTRRILWRMGVPFYEREAIASLVRHHLVPFFLSESDNPDRLAIEVSQSARCDWLSILAEADARGRTCPDPRRLLAQVARFRERCVRLNCLQRPFVFPNHQSRFLYFRDPVRTPEIVAEEAFRSKVILMCGLPGVGKDYWVQKYFPEQPMVSLDALRAELGVGPSDMQGLVLQKARELARVHLEAGQNFIWNATNLSRHVRNDCVRFFHEHGAFVRIVYVEVPPERLLAQNRQRRRRVPEGVLERLMDRWEVPDRTEAHQVDWIVG